MSEQCSTGVAPGECRQESERRRLRYGPAFGILSLLGGVCAVAAVVVLPASFASASFMLGGSTRNEISLAYASPAKSLFAPPRPGVGSRVERGMAVTGHAANLAGVTAEKADRLQRLAPASSASALEARFDGVAMQASLSSKDLARLFQDARGLSNADAPALIAHAAPERFGSALAGHDDLSSLVLAYADPSPNAAGGALAALDLTLNGDTALAPDDLLTDDDQNLALPDFHATPDNSPIPLRRPRAEKAPVVEQQEEATQPSKPKAAEAAPIERPAKKQLAYARPNEPREKSGGGWSLRNLFGGGPKPRGGVAVYDISAAKVYMPDGSVLEAHSGIGKMADNPRYVNVKMGGATPPHTYNLQMREKRFHGVEAIRMLPVDGKNKHGRDGFLTHSYLLRGGRAESHGCVAFKNYDKFLTAFKKGKIKQLVVVSGGGRRAVQVASNGRGV